MSFLHDTVLPGAARLHVSVPPAAEQRQARKSQSHGGFLKPLVRLVRDPAGAIQEVVGGYNTGLQDFAPKTTEDDTRRQLLYLQMKDATTHLEWRTAATELDHLEGNDAWKLEKESAEYDVALVEARLKQLDEARVNCDVSRMLFLIRTSLTRGLGDMGDLRLYKHSHIGTKALIEEYIDSAQKTLAALLEHSAKTNDSRYEPRNLLEQLLAARQSFGRSALLLSGGGTFGMNHTGVVKTLWHAHLLPRIISGSSAGSIVCAVLCTRTDQEIPEVLEEFCYGDLDVFEKEGEEEGIIKKAARFLKYGVIFDISHLVRVMKGFLGDMTFQEAYNRTRRVLNITVSSASLYELPRLLNYVTAPNVMIWSAVAASCSVPFVFTAASLLAKDPKTGKEVPWNPSPQHWIDGSVDNDLPITRLAEMFNVNHFIVSQVNPHVVPFLVKEEDEIATEAQQSTPAFAAGPGWLHHMANLAKGEALHRMHVLAEMGIFPNYLTKCRSVLSQRYSGDITIFPEISYTHFPKILSNPTTEFMRQAMLAGEKATWPKMSRIQNHCAIELALDKAVQQLRARVVFSPSQVDLRLNAYGRPVSEGTERRIRSSHKNTRSMQPEYLDHEKKDLHARFYLPVTDNEARRPSIPGRKNTGTPITIKTTSLDIPPNNSAHLSSSTPELDSSDADAPFSTSSSSPSSPVSPPSPTLPTLWPSTRQLFPSASQPTTPSISSRMLGSTSPLAMTKTASNSRTPQPPQPRPSSPEMRYKRLFHTGPKHSPPAPADSSRRRGSTPGVTVSGEGKKRKGHGEGSGFLGRGLGLKLDISGTRGMVLRRKKSGVALAKGATT